MSRVDGKPYFLYVLWSPSSRRFYIGISEDPDQRLTQHNAADARGWTRGHQPWSLVHVERYESYDDARRRELDLKAQKGGAGFFLKTGLDRALFKTGS
jgi:predicted GIY-YIG superfamily endonuclease